MSDVQTAWTTLREGVQKTDQLVENLDVAACPPPGFCTLGFSLIHARACFITTIGFDAPQYKGTWGARRAHQDV